MSVNGAVIRVVRPVVDRARVERGRIIPRQHVVRLERPVKKVDSTTYKAEPHLAYSSLIFYNDHMDTLLEIYSDYI